MILICFSFLNKRGAIALCRQFKGEERFLKKPPYLKKCKFLWDYMKLGQVGIKVILREQKLQQMKPCFCFCCSLHICELLSVFLQFFDKRLCLDLSGPLFQTLMTAQI